MDTFTRAYLECALWSTTDESTPTGGEPMDANYDLEDISPECLAQAQADCAAFQAQAGDMIADDLGGAGHDFWLTRNGHGAGFWDGDWGAHGDALTALAESFGTVDLYVGDDNRIYA